MKKHEIMKTLFWSVVIALLGALLVDLNILINCGWLMVIGGCLVSVCVGVIACLDGTL